jgi:hypothetical protein
MQKSLRRECLLGILCVLGLVVTVAWAQTAPPPASAKGKLERLRVAAAPVGWDTNLTWLHPRSGSLDKNPFWNSSLASTAALGPIFLSWPRSGRWLRMAKAGPSPSARA